MNFDKINNIPEQTSFVKRFGTNIRPVIESDESLLHIFKKITDNENIANQYDAEKLDKIMEKFETKVFIMEKNKSKYDQNAKRILLSASDPLSFITMNELVNRLSSNRRCKSIGLIADGVAGVSFDKLFKEQKDEGSKFQSIRAGKPYVEGDKYDKNVPVFADILRLTEPGGFDIALLPCESLNTPSNSLLFSSKENLGAKELYIIFDGWGFDRKDLIEQIGKSDKIDGIFCNDEFAKKILLNLLKDAKDKFKDRIYPTGTPVLDTLEADRKELYAQSGREKMGIGKEEKVVLFLGDISWYFDAGRTNISENVNEETFEKTLQAMTSFCKKNMQQKYVFLVRPHPRDPRKDELKELSAVSLPDNLRVIFSDNLNIQESIYSSDIIASIKSTENFLAKLRGKKSIFLAFKDKGLGLDLLKSNYSEEIVDALKNDKDVVLATDTDELEVELEKILNVTPGEVVDNPGNYTENLIKKLLE